MVAIASGRPDWPLAGTVQTIGTGFVTLASIDIPLTSQWFLKTLIVGFESGGLGRAVYERNALVNRLLVGAATLQDWVDAPLSRRSSGGLTDSRLSIVGGTVLVEVEGTSGATWEWACYFQSFGTGTV